MVYDWADDENLDLAETLSRFDQLEPADIAAPDRLGCGEGE